MGGSFLRAAKSLGLSSQFVDYRLAFDTNRVWRSLHWRLLGHRPPKLNRYNKHLTRAIDISAPSVILTTGICPAIKSTLAYARSAGCVIVNFSTDDPWNPGLMDRRFLESLPLYDVVFTPRRANIGDFMKAGVRRVEFLPFAFDEVFTKGDFRPKMLSDACGGPDVLFVGGGDTERFRLLRPLLASNLCLRVYGNYWSRARDFRDVSLGQADPQVVLEATRTAKIALCAVRRANRDGHVMRTFEIGAIGTCMLAEDTPEHREILGETAEYFSSPEELAQKAEMLVKYPTRRASLGLAMQQRILGGANTYTDRLRAMYSLASSGLRS